MATFKNLSNYTDNKISNVLETNGAFYAFSNSQFEEKKQDGVKYVNLQGGLICPKENANNLIKSFDEIYTNAIKEQVQEFGAKRIISYEYFNHETQISGDIEQIKAVLSQYVSLFPNQFTEELINTTCNECFQYAIENDCF